MWLTPHLHHFTWPVYILYLLILCCFSSHKQPLSLALALLSMLSSLMGSVQMEESCVPMSPALVSKSSPTSFKHARTGNYSLCYHIFHWWMGSLLAGQLLQVFVICGCVCCNLSPSLEGCTGALHPCSLCKLPPCQLMISQQGLQSEGIIEGEG